jgi:trimethylamine--corrinoid protein Co-methyltransferase
LEEYEQPPLDEAIRSELQEYVDRRRTELGD